MPYTDVFASDISTNVRAVLCENFKDLKPGGKGTLYSDVTKRSNSEAAEVDIYTAGFPCQPYSGLGLGVGAGDHRGQRVVDKVIDYLAKKTPRCFVLENVTGLVHRHRRFFDWILNKLNNIKDPETNMPFYVVEWDIVNSHDYGLPQSRNRVLIVGIHSRRMVAPFIWPDAKPKPSLDTILEPYDKNQVQSPALPTSVTGLSNYAKCLEVIKAKGGKIGQKGQNWVGNMATSSAYGPGVTFDYSPCITKTHANSFYIFSRGRCRGVGWARLRSIGRGMCGWRFQMC